MILIDPVHTLLPILSQNTSHEITIRFNSVCNVTKVTKLIFGAPGKRNEAKKIEISPIEKLSGTPVVVCLFKLQFL